MIYSFHDVADDHDNYGMCEHDMQQQLCPSDETLPCSSLQNIRQFCKQQIGPKLVEKEPRNSGRNSIKGCIKYVGYHILDQDHIACCESAHCEKWLDAKIDEVHPNDVRCEQ